MSIGERICFFRNKRGLTQEQLGRLIGLPDNSADVRITQYESGSRKPKGDVIKALAEVFGISPFALSISDIDDPLVILHTLFAMEDIYGAWVEKNLSAIALNFDPYNNENAARLFKMLCDWREQFEKRINGIITKEEYDNWRYNTTAPTPIPVSKSPRKPITPTSTLTGLNSTANTPAKSRTTAKTPRSTNGT